MTGDCPYYGICECKGGYYVSGDGCKSMSFDSFISHQEFFAENQYFDLNLVVIRRGHPKFFFSFEECHCTKPGMTGYCRTDLFQEGKCECMPDLYYRNGEWQKYVKLIFNSLSNHFQKNQNF